MTDEEKEQLNKALQVYKQTGDVMSTLNNEQQAINEKFQEQKNPDKKEEKKINKRIRNIWNNYRNNILEGIDLENYKKFCDLEKEKAQTEKDLIKIQHDKEKESAEHWIDMHSGNLKEIGYNTESVPNKFFYGLDRGIFYIKNICKNIPKLTWYILAGIFGLGLVILMAIGLSKLV